MSRRVSLASALMCGLLVTTAFANRAFPDLAVPPEKPENEAPLLVKRDRTASVSRIVIPRKFLGDAKVVAPGAAPNAGAAPNEGAAAPDPTRSIIAGIALSLALVASFFAFRKRKPVLAIATAAGALLIGVLGFWAATASANLAPPEERQQKIVIDIVDEGETVVLTLGRGT